MLGRSRCGAAALQRGLGAGGGRILGTYCKRELPNYQVFDERRYFASGRDAGLPPLVVDVDGTKVGVLICEDAWFDEPAQAACDAGAELLCVINASPFHLDKAGEREARMADRARAVQRPLLYAHLVGGQDEVVFDGASFALDAAGSVTARAPAFAEALLMLDTGSDGAPRGAIAPVPELEAQAWAALVTGVRDYLGKNGFPGAIIGLSGGMDSALVLAIAVDALGADKVRAVMMPSPYTRRHLVARRARDGRASGACATTRSPSRRCSTPFAPALADEFRGNLPEDTTEENIQARIRGTLLMALSNKTRLDRADHRQQERDGHRLLHAVWRHGWRLRGHQGRRPRRWCTAWPRWKNQQAQPARRWQHRAGDPRTHHHAGAVGRAAARTRPTRTACRRMRCSTRSWRCYMEDDQSIEADRRRRFCTHRRGACDAPHQGERVQAAPGTDRHPHHPSRVRA